MTEQKKTEKKIKMEKMSKDEKKNKKIFSKSNIVKAVGIVLAVVILWYMIKSFVDNWKQIEPYLANIKPVWFVVSVIIYAIAFLLTGNNWSYLLHQMDKTESQKEYLNIHMVSALARYIPGGIWNIVGKAYMCTQKKVDKGATTVSMVLEYVFQIVSSALFLLFFIPMALRKYLGNLGVVLLIIAMIAAVIAMPYAINLGIRIVSKIMKSDYEAIHLEKKYIYKVLFRYVIVWVITGAGVIMLTYAFTDITPIQGLYLMLSYPISWVVGFLSPSPNGMGVREGVFGILLGSSYQSELILLITLTSRIWTILGEVLAFISFKIYYVISGRGKHI